MGEELQCHTVSDDTGTPKQVSVGRACLFFFFFFFFFFFVVFFFFFFFLSGPSLFSRLDLV